jgi:thiol reductant ABC exporter CydD subunit
MRRTAPTVTKLPNPCGRAPGSGSIRLVKALDPRLLRYARASRTFLILSVSVGTALALLAVAQAALLATGITAVFQRGAGLNDLRGLMVGLAAVIAVRAALSWLQDVAAQRSGQAVKAQLRQQLFAHVTRLGPGWLTTERSGELTALATRGVDALDIYLARYLPQLMLAVIAPVVVLAWVMPADLIAGLTIVLTLPLIPLFMVLVGLTVAHRTQRQVRSLTVMSHHFLDLVAGLPTLKLFGRAKAQARAIIDVTGEHRRATMGTLRLAFLSSLVLEFLATISVALVAVGIGLRLVSGSLDLRTALLVLILAPEAYLPLRQLGAQYHASAEGLVGAGRVFEVLETEAPPPQPDRPVPVLAADGWLRWQGVSVTFPGRAVPALTGLDLTAHRGEVVALVGPSGSGKSTALAIGLGFVAPDEGRVTVASAGGDLDPTTVGRTAWLRLVSWLPQNPYLVAGTVAENVRLGRPDASDAEVRAALALARAEDVVDALPNGLDTVIGDGGRQLSSGQRQRLALARVYLKDAPMVLLDEPTAGLDAATERAVVEGIRAHARGRIVVVAAHRFALLALADRTVALPGRDRPDSAPPGPDDNAGGGPTVGSVGPFVGGTEPDAARHEAVVP